MQRFLGRQRDWLEIEWLPERGPQFVAQKRSLEDVLQAKSSERVRVLMSEHTQAQVAALDRTTSDILLQIRAVDTQLANGYPHLAAIVKPVPLSVSDVQKR